MENPKTMLEAADMMVRSFDKRLEALFQIEAPLFGKAIDEYHRL